MAIPSLNEDDVKLVMMWGVRGPLGSGQETGGGGGGSLCNERARLGVGAGDVWMATRGKWEDSDVQPRRREIMLKFVLTMKYEPNPKLENTWVRRQQPTLEHQRRAVKHLHP